MRAAESIKRLMALAKRLGGELRIVESDVYHYTSSQRPGFSHAPFTSYGMGIDYENKLVLVEDAEPIGAPKRYNSGEIVHEMAHVFACEVGPDNSQCEEWDFLGWEIAAGRWAGCTRSWLKHMKHYVVSAEWHGDDFLDDWENLSPARKRYVVKDRLSYARKIGLISRRNIPLSIR